MRVRLLTLRFAPSLGGFDERPLAEFVADKDVLAVREHFFVVHDVPHVACLVSYLDPILPDARERPSRSGGPSNHVVTSAPPTAPLSDAERVLYGTLREWRAARARKDGVPPYVIFTNRELAEIARTRPVTPTGLASLDGIGAGKLERYGADVLARLRPPPTSHAERGNDSNSDAGSPT